MRWRLCLKALRLSCLCSITKKNTKKTENCSNVLFVVPSLARVYCLSQPPYVCLHRHRTRGHTSESWTGGVGLSGVVVSTLVLKVRFNSSNLFQPWLTTRRIVCSCCYHCCHHCCHHCRTSPARSQVPRDTNELTALVFLCFFFSFFFVF